MAEERDQHHDPIRDALQSIAAQLEQPNPLEVLGITHELATTLQPEALSLAVKGLYRAHQAQLHPDKTSSTSVQAEKLQLIQAAYDRLTEEGVSPHRDRLLSRKRRGKASAARSNAVVEATRREQSFEEIYYQAQSKSSDFIDGLQSDEALRRIKRGFALIRPISPLPQDKRLPLQSLVIDGGHVFLDDLQIERDTELPLDLGIPKDQIRTDVYVETGRALVRDIDGKLIWQKTNLPNGWHQIRGTLENRTMQSLYLPRHKTRFDPELAGCIPEDLARSMIDEYFKKGSEYRHQKLIELGGAPDDATIPKRLKDRFVVPGGWSKLTTSGDKIHGQLSPKLVEGEVMTARSGSNNLLILGRVEAAMAHYLGE